MEKKTYVEFRCLGTFFDDFIVKEVKNRNPRELTFKKNCIEFSFFDIYSKTIMEDGKEVTLKSDRRCVKEYEIGDLLTIDEVKKAYGEFSSEYKTMEKKELPNAVRTIYNILVNHDENAKVIPQKDLNYEPEKKVEIDDEINENDDGVDME